MQARGLTSKRGFDSSWRPSIDPATGFRVCCKPPSGPHLNPVGCGHGICEYMWLFAADGSAGVGWWGMLVPEGNRQNARWQAAISALDTLQVPEADRLPWQSQLQSDPLRRQSWLQLWPMAAQEHGPTQWERRISASGIIFRLHENHLEGWSVYYQVSSELMVNRSLFPLNCIFL